MRRALVAYSSGAEPDRGAHPDRVPAVAERGRAAERGVGVTADPHRDAAGPDGLGQHVDVSHADIAAGEGDRIRRPGRAHEPHVLVGDDSALLERRCAERFEFFAQPAHADPEEDASARELIDGGQHLGGEHRMPVGNDQHAGAELRTLGDARQAREHREGLEIVLGGAARQLTGRRVWIDRAGHRGREHDVIGDEDRGVAERVGLRGDLQHLVGAGHRATAGKRYTELHESLRNDESGSVTPAHSRPRVQALQLPGM